MNGGHLGFMFTAKDLATAGFARQNKNVRSLAANSEAAAAVYEQSMARIKKGAMMLGIAVIGLGAMVKVTKTFGEFQYVLASAGAVMHATAGEMKVLERAAIDAGIATQFSPREAAEGLQALGAAGLNVKQAVEVLNPVLDLAAASMGQLGVAGAAENVVGVLNAFSMQADKAGMVADKLTRISQLTNFQFRDFGVAISQAAAQAYTADQSFESMLATLGMLRNTNLAASASATAYREAVRRLSGDKRAHKELTKLHVEVLNKETGRIRDLGGIIADLAPRLEKMNSKEKNLVATRIFGVRGMKTYAAFVSQYHKLVKEGVIMTGDYAGAHARLVNKLGMAEGAAKKNRDALLQTAEGQRLLLKGSWETTQIMLGKLALPVVLPALKALTDVLNVAIKILDAIPKPLRSMIANFVGVGLAIKGVVGAFKMLQGVAGIAMLGRMASASTALAEGTGTTAAKVSIMNRQFATGATRLNAFASGARQIAGAWMSWGTVALPIAMGVISYFQQKHAEEMARQKEIRRNNKLSLDSYVAAKQMADKMRAATARSAETELQAARKNYKTALRIVDLYAAKQFELAEKIKTARAKMLLAETKYGAKSKEAREAQAEYIKLGGKMEATNRAVIASEAAAARFAIRRAKSDEDRQVYAAKIIADRYLKQKTKEADYQKTRARRMWEIGKATGHERKMLERNWAVEEKASKRLRARYRYETALMAVKYGLAEKGILQDKRAQRVAIRGIARPRVRAAEAVAPTQAFMERYGVWDRMLSEGRLPRMTAAQLPLFRRYLQARGGELGLGAGDIRRLGLQANIMSQMGGIMGPPAAFGGEEPEPAPAAAPRRFRGVGAERGIWERTTGSITDLGVEIARRMREAQTRVGPTIIRWEVDGEKIAQIVVKNTERGERQQDGTESSEEGVQGAG